MQIDELLAEKRISFAQAGHRHVRHGWVGLHCPYCEGDKYQLGIHKSTHKTTCWRCGPHGLADALSKLSGQPLGICIGWTKELDHYGPRRPEVVVPEQTSVRIPTGIGELLPAHIRYLEKVRGFDPEALVELWKIRGIGIATRLSWRIWIPIHFRNQLVSWTTRAIGNAASRYISASPLEEIRSHKRCLYGIDFCTTSVLICEGPTDVWRVGPGAVATLGLNVGPEQRELLSRFPRRTICFDSTAQAQQRARRLADDLSIFPGKTFVIEADAPDLGEASRREIALIRRAVFGTKDL